MAGRSYKEHYYNIRPDLLDVLLLEPGGSNFSAFGEKIKLIT